MSIAQAIQNAVDATFSAMVDETTEINYVNVSGETYDPITDTNTNTTTTFTGIRAFLLNFTQGEIDNLKVKSKDRKVLISSTSLPDVTPTENDYFTENGTTWQIIQVRSPPKNPVWILQARAAS